MAARLLRSATSAPVRRLALRALTRPPQRAGRCSLFSTASGGGDGDDDNDAGLEDIGAFETLDLENFDSIDFDELEASAAAAANNDDNDGADATRPVEELSPELMANLLSGGGGDMAAGAGGAGSSGAFGDIMGRKGAGNLSIESQQKYEEMLEDVLFRAVQQHRGKGYWGPATFDDKMADPFAYYEREVNRSWEMQKCYFTFHGIQDLHYANTPLLSMFVSRFGNILPRSQTHLTAKMQRKLARTIKTSRQAGLMPYKGTWNGLRTGIFTPEMRRALREEDGLPPLSSIEPNPEEAAYNF